MRFLPILLFLLFVFALIKIALRSRVVGAESPKQLPRDEPDALTPLWMIVSGGKPFTIISVADAFDPDSAILWDTQIPALEFICSAGREGVDVNALRPFYSSSGHFYPELYEGSSFHTWLEFLQNEQLIVLDIHVRRVSITLVGTEFLKCRMTAKAAAGIRQ